MAAVMGMLATIGKNPEMKVAFAVPPLKEDNTVAASVRSLDPLVMSRAY